MIKKFNDFVLEELAYLSGHRQPLYHFTYRLKPVLETDMLKMGNPTRGAFGKKKSISVTRNPDFAEHGHIFIELDYTKLYNDGYKALPVDEWAWGADAKPSHRIPNRITNKVTNFGKSQFPEVLSGRRGTKHGTNIPHKVGILETEFEERFLTDIKDLGKYIISINFPADGGGADLATLKKYLEKYPHIKVYNIDKDNHRKKVEITDKYTKPVEKKEPVLESVESQGELLNNLETVLVDLLEPESPYKVELPVAGTYPASLTIEGKNEYNRQTGKWEREFDFDYIKTFLESLDFYMKKEYDRVSYSLNCDGYATAGLDYNEVIKEIGTREPYRLVITGFNSVKHKNINKDI